MKEDLFAELVASLHEGGSILRGDVPASRTFTLLPLDIRRIRDSFGLTKAS